MRTRRSIGRSYSDGLAGRASCADSAPGRRLLAAERGGALLEERGQALARVGGGEEARERLDLDPRRRSAVAGLRRREGGLRAGEGERRPCRELRRPGPRLVLELALRHHPVHEARRPGLVGREQASAVDEVARERDPDPALEARAAPEAGDQTEVRLGLPEARALAGEHEVACEDELAATPERRPLDDRDRDARTRFQRVEDRVPELREGAR